MAFSNYSPKKLIDYYNDNKDKISKQTANETHINLYSGKQIKKFTNNLWHIGKKYGDTVKIDGDKNLSQIGRKDIAIEQYKKFNLRLDSSQTVAWWPIKEPYILRGIQRKNKPTPQYWGTAALGDIPGLGTKAEWVDRKIHAAIRMGKAMLSPNGLVFAGNRLFQKLYVNAYYSFTSHKQVRLRSFKGVRSVTDIKELLEGIRIDKSYAGDNDIAKNFGHRYTWDGSRQIDPYNAADAGVFKKFDQGAMIPITFENIDGTDHIEFRAMNFKSPTLSWSADWGSKNYVGRPDAFHVYNNSKRGAISIGFTVVAFSFMGMKGMYQKLNILTGMTQPIYTPHFRMISPLAKLSIGDYIIGEDGYLSSVQITPIDNLPWEIGLTGAEGKSLTLHERAGLKSALGTLGIKLDVLKALTYKSTLKVPDDQKFASKEVKPFQPPGFLLPPGTPADHKGGHVLPRGFDVTVSFTPIENELPMQLGINRLLEKTRANFGPNEWLIAPDDIPNPTSI